MNKAEILLRYAQADAQKSGLKLKPDDTLDLDTLAHFMSRAGQVLFLVGDPNKENMKRNISIRIFIDFSLNQIFDYFTQQLDSWKNKNDKAWMKEWREITRRKDPSELEKILLSTDEEATRKRISMPSAGLLDYATILQMKRRGSAL